jgi:actin-related protein
LPGIHARLTAAVRSELQTRGLASSLVDQLYIHPIASPTARIQSLTVPRATMADPPDVPWGQLSETGPNLLTLQTVAEYPTDITVWRGGSILACDAAFVPNWIHKTEYDEVGPNVMYRKCLLA